MFPSNLQSPGIMSVIPKLNDNQSMTSAINNYALVTTCTNGPNVKFSGIAPSNEDHVQMVLCLALDKGVKRDKNSNFINSKWQILEPPYYDNSILGSPHFDARKFGANSEIKSTSVINEKNCCHNDNESCVNCDALNLTMASSTTLQDSFAEMDCSPTSSDCFAYNNINDNETEHLIKNCDPISRCSMDSSTSSCYSKSQLIFENTEPNRAGLYLCHLCSFTGTSRMQLQEHLDVHFEHCCLHCGYKSRTLGRMNKHLTMFHDDQQQGQGNQSNVKDESSLFLTGGGSVTNLCDNNSQSLSMTVQQINNSSLPFNVNFNGLSSNIPNAAKPKEKCYRCKQCQHVATNKTLFWQHSRTHMKEDKILECPKCEFITEYKHHLEYHIRNHFGSKPFKCRKCNYQCVNKSMLNSHMKSHTNIYQFRCAQCQYATKYCHSLKLHLLKYNHLSARILNLDGSLPQQDIVEVAASQVKNFMNTNNFDTNSMYSRHDIDTTNNCPGPSIPNVSAFGRSFNFLNAQTLCGDSPNIVSRFFKSLWSPATTFGLPSFQSQTSMLPQLMPSTMSSFETEQQFTKFGTETSTAMLLNNNNFKCHNCNFHCDSIFMLSLHTAHAHPFLTNPYSSFTPASLSEEVLDLRAIKGINEETNNKRLVATTESEITTMVEDCVAVSPHKTTFYDGAMTQRNSIMQSNSKECRQKRRIDGICAKLQDRDFKAKQQNYWNGSAMKSNEEINHSDSIENDSKIICNITDTDQQQKICSQSDLNRKDYNAIGQHIFQNYGAALTMQNKNSAMYECEHCDLMFKNRMMYDLHMGYHGYSNPFKCNRCGETLRDKVDFFLHLTQRAH